MADESRRLIKGMMARFVHLTVIREAGYDVGEVDCSKQLDDDDDLDIGQRARDHLQFADAEAAVIEENAVVDEGALYISDAVRARFYQQVYVKTSLASKK